jgi:uncharacterized protein (TIGR02246 family)
MFKYPLFIAMLICAKTVGAQTNAAKDEALIRAARQASNTAIAKHDAEGVAKCLLTDFTMVRGNATQATGRDAVTAAWKKLFAANPQVKYIRTPLQVTVSKNDTLAWETGTWKAEHSYSGGGNYSAMWRKRDGVWMTQAELFVSLEK